MLPKTQKRDSKCEYTHQAQTRCEKLSPYTQLYVFWMTAPPHWSLDYIINERPLRVVP